MPVPRISPPLLFLCALTAIYVAASSTSAAQEPSTPPGASPQVHRNPYSPYQQLRVDQNCRLLPDPSRPVAGNKKQRPYKDPEICHLEAVLSSNHIEERTTANQIERSSVSITEQTYVLQNTTDAPATFVVEQLVPEGWAVDSDPPPTDTAGATAIFRVNAQAGEIVQLHVGLRHSKPLRSKALKPSPFSPPGPVTN